MHQGWQAHLSHWNRKDDIWLFGYGSLIWKPGFAPAEQRPAQVFGWHRSLQMWSRTNRGTPDCPGLVLALLQGGSCRGMALRVRSTDVPAVLDDLWEREMRNAVYTPRWLHCRTAQGPLNGLAFTLPRSSPYFTGPLSDNTYRHIFAHAKGRYGTTADYVRETSTALQTMGIRDQALEALHKRYASSTAQLHT